MKLYYVLPRPLLTDSHSDCRNCSHSWISAAELYVRPSLSFIHVRGSRTECVGELLAETDRLHQVAECHNGVVARCQCMGSCNYVFDLLHVSHNLCEPELIVYLSAIQFHADQVSQLIIAQRNLSLKSICSLQIAAPDLHSLSLVEIWILELQMDPAQDGRVEVCNSIRGHKHDACAMFKLAQECCNEGIPFQAMQGPCLNKDISFVQQ